MIEIPLNSNPEQLFSITIGEQTYDIRVISNSRRAMWTISFAQSGVDILNGVALFGGVDILRQHHLPIKNMYVVDLENNKLDPSLDNLGTAAKLFILTDEEVVSG